MSTTKETLEVTKNIVIDAPPEVVFKAITDQNELTLFESVWQRRV
jgi:uncharacterized protein YndB with AHSA1/START domain